MNDKILMFILGAVAISIMLGLIHTARILGYEDGYKKGISIGKMQAEIEFLKIQNRQSKQDND